MRGHGRDEHGLDAESGEVIVRIDTRYFRPTEVNALLGDATKARTKLGWKPELSFQTLVQEMVAEDLQLARRDATIAREGFKTFRHQE